jgi:hypothetical protein
MSALLPAGFAALEPFVAQWALATMSARATSRDESTPQERAAFYAAAKDLIAPALELLDCKPLLEFDAADRRLRDLTLSFCHVALAIEIQDDAETQHAMNRGKMRIVHDGSNSTA